MSKTLKHFISFSFAFLIGFTSIGYSADLHFCKGALKSMAFFGSAKKCHEISGATSCHKSEICPDLNKQKCSENPEDSCCKNEKVQDIFDYHGAISLEVKKEKKYNSLPSENYSSFASLMFRDFGEFCIKKELSIAKKYISYGIDLRITMQSFLC